MSLKRAFLSVAVFALMLSLTRSADAQTRLRLRANDIFPADGGPIAGNSGYEERNNAPTKIEVQVQNVRAATTWIDSWLYSTATGDFVYFASLELVGGIGRVENQTQLGEFVPHVRAGDYLILFDSVTYDWMGWGWYEIN